MICRYLSSALSAARRSSRAWSLARRKSASFFNACFSSSGAKRLKGTPNPGLCQRGRPVA